MLVPGKMRRESGRHALGKASLAAWLRVLQRHSEHDVLWEHVQEPAGFVRTKSEAAAPRRVTFTLEQEAEGKVSAAVADTWPAIACPGRGGDCSPGPAAAALSPAPVCDDPCSAATVLCCDTTSHRHGNKSITASLPPGRDPRRGREEGICTFPCTGGTDGCQKARGELRHGTSRRPHGPTRRDAHRIPLRRQQGRGTAGAAEPCASLLSDVLPWEKSL